MPPRKPNTDNADTQLDKLLSGRDDKGRFLKRTQQLEKMKDVIRKLSAEQSKLQKQMERSTKSALKGLKVENQLLRGKSRLQGQVQRLTQNLNRQRRAIEKSTRSNKLFAGSFGRIAAGVGAAALAFRAFRQIQDIANSRRNLAVSGGLASLQNVKQFIGKDIAIVSGAQLVDQFLQQGLPQLAIGRQPVISKGLLKIQEELSGVGTELANRIILDLSSSFRDPRRLKSFFGDVGRGEDVEQTLRKFQTQEPASVTATLRALNALQVSQLPTTGDSILDAQTELSTATEKLKAEFENLSATVANDLVPILKQLIPELKKALEFLGGLTTKELLLGVGAIAIAPTALRVASRGLIGRGIPSVGKGLLNAGKFALKVPATAATTASGAAVAAGSGFTLFRSIQTAKAEREALRASQSALQDERLFKVAAKNKKLNDRLSKLKGKRQEIDALLLTQPASGIGTGGFFSPDIPQPNQKQIAKLRKQRRNVQSEIDVLQKRNDTENKVVVANKKQIKALNSSSKAVNNFAEKLKKTPETKIDRDLSLLFKRADLEIDALESQSQTALRRAELEIAKIGPFGILQAGSEASKFLDQLQSQEAVLREILGTLDTSTREGRIQGNQLLLQVRNLEREEKELRRSLVTAFLDQSLQQALGAGRFSKILVTSDQNVGIGLRQGVFGLPKDIRKQLLGSVDPKIPKIKSRTALEILGGKSPFDIRKLTPTMSNKRQPPKTRKSNLSGSTSGDSIINIGNELKKVGRQIKTENQEVDNQFAEPIGTYAYNRLINVQAN